MPRLNLHFYNPKKDTEGVWNKLVALLDPPYCHCEIEFLHGLSCAVYINGPVHMKTRQFDANFYDCVSIQCSPYAYDRALDYCTRKTEALEMFSLSMMLASKLPPLRFSTSGTFCSKMCAEALLEAGVLPADLNPRLLTPSALSRALTSAGPAAPPDQGGATPALDFAVCAV
jgi:hypothetical protein